MSKTPPPAPSAKKVPMAAIKEAIEERDEILARMKVDRAREMELRKWIASQLFPAPAEGSNRYVVAGIEANLTHKLDRKVDEPAFFALKPMLLKNKLPVDALIEAHLELKMKVYRTLSAAQLKLFDRVLIIKPAAPQLEVNV